MRQGLNIYERIHMKSKGIRIDAGLYNLAKLDASVRMKQTGKLTTPRDIIEMYFLKGRERQRK